MNALEAREFFELPLTVRTEINEWTNALGKVQKPVTRALRVVADRFGVSYATAVRKYYAFQANGWRGLINEAKAGSSAQRLPRAFVEEWRKRCEDRTRKSKAAWQQLVKDWYAGEIIPGYEDCAASDRRELPPGWSYENLMRHKPTRAELDATRIGLGHAAKYLPKVFGTRVGLWPGSHYMFDDLFHDHFVLFNGQQVRVLEFDALDVFSGCKIDWVTKPRFQRADGTFDGLKESQMRILLAKVFAEVGYSPRGTELIAEHGTAAISEELERFLHDFSGGLIRVRRSGITGKEQAVIGQWQGKGGGNPRFKGALESLRNLIHNRLDMLPAQTGRNVETRPEPLHGRLAYNERMLKIADRLPVATAQLLRLPILDYNQFCAVLLEIYSQINQRTEHELEGWVELGHQIVEYRLSTSVDAWLSPGEFLALPAPEQACIRGLVTANPASYTRTRYLSPQEVWSGGRRHLVPLTAPMVCGLLGHETAEEARVDAGYFCFTNAHMGPGEFRYSSRCRDQSGRQFELRDGERFLTLVNPAQAERLYVMDHAGRYIGECQRDHRVARNDLDGLRRKMGEVNARNAELLNPLRVRHSSLTEEMLDLRKHNLDVIESATRNKTDQKQLDRAAKVGAVLRDTSPVPPSEPGDEPASEIVDLT